MLDDEQHVQAAQEHGAGVEEVRRQDRLGLSAQERPDGRKVMRAQLEHLLELTDLPNVTLQIVPFNVGPHTAAGGPFTILRFPEPDLPDIVYLEQLHSALYLDQPDDVIGYVTVMDQLCVQAATGAASKDTLGALLKQA
jgi:hypothetical protein